MAFEVDQPLLHASGANEDPRDDTASKVVLTGGAYAVAVPSRGGLVPAFRVRCGIGSPIMDENGHHHSRSSSGLGKRSQQPVACVELPKYTRSICA